MTTVSTEELAAIAHRHRGFREAGAALLLSSAVLAIFFFIPLAPEKAKPAPAALASTTPAVFVAPPIEAKAAIVYDLTDGKTLYAKNAGAQLPLASLTKLLTVYAAVSELPLAATVTVSASDTAVDMPHAFAPGATYELQNIARLTLTASLNDGAAAIADTVAAAESRSTSEALAGAAAALDLSQTYALNGNGLDLSTTQSGGYGSAFDIARLAGALVAKAPSIALATTRQTASASAENGASITVKNTDPMTPNFPGLLLSKTGFTDLAGGNLALVFDAGIEHPVAVVVLGSSKDARFTDGAALVAAAETYFAHATP
ncbi:MAG: hypothetical protein KGI78_01575 [Patescibacteria group bacterium]|nr:hypothetical protein [Patescibacteria group bacterium]MDE1943949.1 hypothetical protein [Patescibacteria group bacterium]MDE1945018.1 hypothetical protein [Patescibacteria group bacterium]MDE2057524.1 hypothetical protein [Patescibacteria group bacterium]